VVLWFTWEAVARSHSDELMPAAVHRVAGAEAGFAGGVT
jgi:hypothetical protein